MNAPLEFRIIDGIRCYSPELSNDFAAYPERGFDLTDKNADRSFWVSSRNRLFKRLVQQYLLPAQTKFLEIGCATGDFLRQLSGIQGLEITGSEIYLEGLKYAKSYLPNINLIQFDVTKGTIGEEFDIIAAFDVIEHIEDDVKALDNIYKMLCKEGVLLISVPQHRFLWSKLDELVMHQRRYSRDDLLTKLKKCGFEIEYKTSFVFMLFPLMLISRMIDSAQKPGNSEDMDLEKRVKFNKLLNTLFDFIMRVDEFLIGHRISLPFGGTLLVIAKKI